MGIKIIALVVVFLVGIQMMTVAILTRRNRDFLDKYKATSYAKAMADLAQVKPKTVFVIRCCYAACLTEVAVLAVMKFLN